MEGFLKTPKYTDGITYVRTSKQQISELDKKMSEFLKKFDLIVNINTAERFFILKSPPPPLKIQIRKL